MARTRTNAASTTELGGGKGPSAADAVWGDTASPSSRARVSSIGDMGLSAGGVQGEQR